MIPPPPTSTLFPYTTLFRSVSTASKQPHVVDRIIREAEVGAHDRVSGQLRSEEHTSELQSHSDLVCRLLLEKKKDFYSHTNESETGINQRSKTVKPMN